LKQAEAAYDAALADLAAAQESTQSKSADVYTMAVDLEFLKSQLEYAQSRTTELLAKFEIANADVLLCIADPDSCTVADK